MLEDGQPKGREGQGSGVTTHRDEASLVIWVVIFKVVNYFPQKQWLDHFDGLLYEKKKPSHGLDLRQKTTIHTKRLTSPRTYQWKNKQPRHCIGLPIALYKSSWQVGILKFLCGLFNFTVPKSAKNIHHRSLQLHICNQNVTWFPNANLKHQSYGESFYQHFYIRIYRYSIYHFLTTA